MADERIKTQRLFVYGTLKFGLLRTILLGRFVKGEPYKLKGFRKVKLNIVPDNEASVSGHIINVTEEDLKTLDRFERVGRRYERRTIAMGDRPSFVYIRLKL